MNKKANLNHRISSEVSFYINSSTLFLLMNAINTSCFFYIGQQTHSYDVILAF